MRLEGFIRVSAAVAEELAAKLALKPLDREMPYLEVLGTVRAGDWVLSKALF